MYLRTNFFFAWKTTSYMQQRDRDEEPWPSSSPTCIAWLLSAYPLTKSQYTVVARLGPDKSSMVLYFSEAAVSTFKSRVPDLKLRELQSTAEGSVWQKRVVRLVSVRATETDILLGVLIDTVYSLCLWVWSCPARVRPCCLVDNRDTPSTYLTPTGSYTHTKGVECVCLDDLQLLDER